MFFVGTHGAGMLGTMSVFKAFDSMAQRNVAEGERRDQERHNSRLGFRKTLESFTRHRQDVAGRRGSAASMISWHVSMLILAS